MKKLLIASLVLGSISAFANESLVSGVIAEVECSSRAGLGVMGLETMEDNVKVTTYYKVDSDDLCSASQKSLMFLGSTSKLAALSSTNTGLVGARDGEVNYTTFKLEGDKIVEIVANELVSVSEYYDGLDSEERRNAAAAHKWYFSEAKGIDTTNWPDN